ncbi:hypothetical protein [Sphingomonas sp. BK345]|uniref:hypothetical protein n=1 Tax=Sphingomonas sp. BK345 TaxID=2586980 RepID=UPI00160ECFC2|nr:hypothetical protein [Sphingomonas sp. BK345]MBB3472909.1 hypothetical protein [Sphingomonas sp. BK345]
MPMLPCLPRSAAEYRDDAAQCRELAKGVSEPDAELMLALARINDERARQAAASARWRTGLI